MSIRWYAENPEYVHVENLFETLANLGIYWKIDEDDIEKDELYHDLISCMWDEYHSPYLESKTLINRIKKLFHFPLRAEFKGTI